MDTQQLKQCIDDLEQCADDARNAMQSAGNVPQPLREGIENLHQQARMAKKDGSGNDDALRDKVMQIEQAADRAMQACRTAGNVDPKLQQAVQKADFSKAYEEQPRNTPLGAEPLLLGRIQTGRDRKGLPVLALHPAEGQGVTLTLDSVLLHSLCRLLQSAVKKSGWDLELKLPGAESPAQGERAGRTIN